ncbi:MAG: NAD(+) synthase [Peptoniphilaceae bacterium]|uniref:NAD(+) synthase n=1 Tax=Parvimonas sp. TaxID=1944660 RepID=UPI0025E25487|nr:NAD(+) synthase [Parvimonas sp.]MCI5997969.1 NAD(+) synthase [Parvimonas sp.]MDD7765103.1 NAD(+) synthase [Peptoniphilaceae bacterium]MDY3051473.1 NAD(+) synthase [Parvimonas sp.]
MKKIVEELVKWLQNSVKEANCKGVVYGLSGGVDSAVVAGLCKLAFGDNALAVMMPINSLESDETDARLVVDKFSLNVEKVDLSNTFSEMKNVFEKGDNSMAYANIKPRLRMTTLYYYAQLKGYLVIGTSNKSEFTVGYFTKYGDSGSDLMPLVDFTKKEIYELAKYLEIPDKIIQKPPSAGLFENQTDEDEMGFSYDDLEKYINNKPLQNEIKIKIEKMIKISEHKRCFAKGYYRR